MTPEEKLKALIDAALPFVAACALLDAMPGGQRLPDSAGAGPNLPSAWPTMWDLRRLAQAFHAAGGER